MGTSEAGDEVATRASATLNAAQDAARRVRRTVNNVANISGLLTITVGFQGTVVMGIFGLPFGPVGVVVMIALVVSTVTLFDPVLPRKTRMILGNLVVVFLPEMAVDSSALAVLACLMPMQVFSFCSTHNGPDCENVRILAVAYLGSNSLAFAWIACALVPTLHPTDKKVFDDPDVLIKQQQTMLKESRTKVAWYEWRNPGYMLEGVPGYYAMPANEAVDYLMRITSRMGFLLGPTTIALALAVHAIGLPTVYSWYGFCQ